MSITKISVSHSYDEGSLKEVNLTIERQPWYQYEITSTEGDMTAEQLKALGKLMEDKKRYPNEISIHSTSRAVLWNGYLSLINKFVLLVSSLAREGNYDGKTMDVFLNEIAPQEGEPYYILNCQMKNGENMSAESVRKLIEALTK